MMKKIQNDWQLISSAKRKLTPKKHPLLFAMSYLSRFGRTEKKTEAVATSSRFHSLHQKTHKRVAFQMYSYFFVKTQNVILKLMRIIKI